MSDESVIIENRKYRKIDDGIFQAVSPFEVNIDEWTYDKNHMGVQAITNAYGEDSIATIFYISTSGASAIKLISLFNNMRKMGQEVGYIEGLPENNAMGELRKVG